MNPMLFGSMKLAALIAVFVFSAGVPQASACNCEHCPSKIESKGASPESKVDSCCETASSSDGQPCPCGCKQIKPDQGLEPQSEVLSLDLASEQAHVSRLTDQSLIRAVALASPVSFSGAAICVALCRFRL